MLGRGRTEHTFRGGAAVGGGSGTCTQSSEWQGGAGGGEVAGVPEGVPFPPARRQGQNTVAGPSLCGKLWSSLGPGSLLSQVPSTCPQSPRGLHQCQQQVHSCQSPNTARPEAVPGTNGRPTPTDQTHRGRHTRGTEGFTVGLGAVRRHVSRRGGRCGHAAHQRWAPESSLGRQ